MTFSIRSANLNPVAAALLLALAGCATVPPGPPPEVVRLQNDLDSLHNDPNIAQYAGDELRVADNAVAALAADARHEDEALYAHQLYLADRFVATARAQGLARYAEQRAKDLGAERDRLMADARTRELNDARAQIETERERAEIARNDAMASRAETDALRADLADLQARQTQQGYTITLGDFLFETARADLKPGAERTLDGLVRVLRDDPGATIEIDGHTDAVGSRDYNLDLSLRRAQAVRDYLTSRGIDPSRLTAQGLGPDYPVASNGTEAGRQQNRRVEVIARTTVTRESSSRY